MLKYLSDFTYEVDFDRLQKIQAALDDLKKLPVNSFVLTIDAHASATIEGARTTVMRVVEALEEGPVSKDDYMCVNCIKAANLMQTMRTLDEVSIIDCWKTLTHNCCDNKGAGCDGYRTDMVYVGSEHEIIHVPAQPEEITKRMSELFNFRTGSTLLDSIIAHFYFVYVHPFCDVNGRLARLLTLYILGNFNLPLAKAISLNLKHYYSTIRQVESTYNLTPFINYMLDMIENAIYLYSLLSNDLSEDESLLLSKMDKTGKGTISLSKATAILNKPMDAVHKVLRDLEIKGYLEYTVSGWRLLWR